MMKTFDIRNSKLIGPIIVFIMLGLLYWLDIILISWHRQAFQTFNIKPFFYFNIALLILFAIIVIFLAWLLLIYSQPSWVTLIFCLLTGSIILGLQVFFRSSWIFSFNIESPRNNCRILCDLRSWLRINNLACRSLRFGYWDGWFSTQNSGNNFAG